jgi:lipopolysaccharide biosynthesis glycosyltransferase
VVGKLSELLEQPLDGYPVGAVYDNYVKVQPLIGINEENQYFNSGVLLIDIFLWNELKISEKCFEYLGKHPERIKYVDQCALNAVLKGNWKHLDIRFNCMYSYIPLESSEKVKREFLNDKVILHFTLQRPWTYLCKNPYRSLYRKYLKKAPGGHTAKAIDFTWKQVPAAIKIRFNEWYWNSSLFQKIWRSIKWR